MVLVQYNTFTENSQKHFKVSDFKSPLMDDSGINSARVAKVLGFKGDKGNKGVQV